MGTISKIQEKRVLMHKTVVQTGGSLVLNGITATGEKFSKSTCRRDFK